MLTRYHDIDNATCIWVGVEEVKRFALALFKISNLCQDGAARLALSELQFPAPDNNDVWRATSRQERQVSVSKRGETGIPEEVNEDKWISECGEILDRADPGFQWV